MSEETDTRVLYNENCPVCRFEIHHYRDYARNEALSLGFDHIDRATDWGLDRDTAARRLHVVKDGQLYAGIPAFLVLWREMPRYRWLARVVGLPGIRQAAGLAYDWILAPLIYRWHLAREARAARKST